MSSKPMARAFQTVEEINKTYLILSSEDAARMLAAQSNGEIGRNLASSLLQEFRVSLSTRARRQLESERQPTRS